MVHSDNKHSHGKHTLKTDKLSFAQVGITARLLVALSLSALVWGAIMTVLA